MSESNFEKWKRDQLEALKPPEPEPPDEEDEEEIDDDLDDPDYDEDGELIEPPILTPEELAATNPIGFTIKGDAKYLRTALEKAAASMKKFASTARTLSLPETDAVNEKPEFDFDSTQRIKIGVVQQRVKPQWSDVEEKVNGLHDSERLEVYSEPKTRDQVVRVLVRRSVPSDPSRFEWRLMIEVHSPAELIVALQSIRELEARMRRRRSRFASDEKMRKGHFDR